MRKLVFGLFLTSMCLQAVALTGCGGSSEPVAPEKFAPPPTEKDEKSSDKG